MVVVKTPFFSNLIFMFKHSLYSLQDNVSTDSLNHLYSLSDEYVYPNVAREICPGNQSIQQSAKKVGNRSHVHGLKLAQCFGYIFGGSQWSLLMQDMMCNDTMMLQTQGGLCPQQNIKGKFPATNPGNISHPVDNLVNFITSARLFCVSGFVGIQAMFSHRGRRRCHQSERRVKAVSTKATLQVFQQIIIFRLNSRFLRSSLHNLRVIQQ